MSEPFTGEIRGFGFYFAPVDWAKCAGQTLTIAQHTALYALLGHAYGAQSSVSFQLPNLQGRMPIGQGTGAGLTPRQIGDYGGLESFYLSPHQSPLPPHLHPAAIDVGSITATTTISVSSTTASGQKSVPENGSTLSNTPAGGMTSADMFLPSGTAQNTPVTLGGVDTVVDPTSASVTVGPNPAVNPARPVDVINPFLAINFSIALQGIFPTRN